MTPGVCSEGPRDPDPSAGIRGEELEQEEGEVPSRRDHPNLA